MMDSISKVSIVGYECIMRNAKLIVTIKKVEIYSTFVIILINYNITFEVFDSITEAIVPTFTFLC